MLLPDGSIECRLEGAPGPPDAPVAESPVATAIPASESSGPQVERGERACQGDFRRRPELVDRDAGRSGPERAGLGVGGARMALRR
jgi:hypothetical protein